MKDIVPPEISKVISGFGLSKARLGWSPLNMSSGILFESFEYSACKQFVKMLVIDIVNLNLWRDSLFSTNVIIF